MKLVVNRTTRKDKSKNQITNIKYDQNSMSIFKKIRTKSNAYQIKPKQNKLTYTSLEKTWDLSSIDWVTGRQKEQKGANFNNMFLFLKTTLK